MGVWIVISFWLPSWSSKNWFFFVFFFFFPFLRFSYKSFIFICKIKGKKFQHLTCIAFLYFWLSVKHLLIVCMMTWILVNKEKVKKKKKKITIGIQFCTDSYPQALQFQFVLHVSNLALFFQQGKIESSTVMPGWLLYLISPPTNIFDILTKISNPQLLQLMLKINFLMVSTSTALPQTWQHWHRTKMLNAWLIK